jgi:DNA-directed RNA polymerase specialized sigma subunit
MLSTVPPASYARSLAAPSRDARAASRSILRALTILTGALRRSPEAHEVAAALGVTESEYGDTLGRIGHAETPALELLELDEGELERAIARIPQDTQNVLSLLYQEGCSFDEVAAVLGMTPARAVALHADAIHRLQAMIVVGRASAATA